MVTADSVGMGFSRKNLLRFFAKQCAKTKNLENILLIFSQKKYPPNIFMKTKLFQFFLENFRQKENFVYFATFPLSILRTPLPLKGTGTQDLIWLKVVSL